MKAPTTRWLTVILSFLLWGCGLAPIDTPDAATPTGTAVTDGYSQARRDMVETVRDWGIEDETVLNALGQVPRHRFVPVEYQDQAYDNHPLPIGYGQTISQPLIVAMMTSELNLEPGDKVLEIGTGSGYQAAILAELDFEVYSIEIIDDLAQRANESLNATGYQEVEAKLGDGYFGWPDQAPFDGIIVTAAPDHVPQPLINQLRVGGRMLIPVGPPGGYQELWRITRTSQDQTERVSLGGVRFVPLVRDQEDN